MFSACRTYSARSRNPKSVISLNVVVCTIEQFLIGMHFELEQCFPVRTVHCMDEWCPTSSVGVCLDPFVLKENIEGAYHIHVSMDSDTSSGFIRNPSVSVFISKMGSQWACIDTSECTGGLNTHCTLSIMS